MSIIDYIMAERTSETVLEKLQNNERIPFDIFSNLQTSIAYLMLSKSQVGNHVRSLYNYLQAMYGYQDADEIPGFQEGAVYGATKLYETIMNIQNKNGKPNA